MTIEKDFSQQAAETLWRDGIAVFNFAEVFGSDLWSEVQMGYERFTTSGHFKEQRDAFVNSPPPVEVDNIEKHFIFRLIPRLHSGEQYTYPDPSIWMDLATHPLMLESAKAYFRGGTPKLAYHDLWYTMPFSELPGGQRPRVASQKWHVDAEAGGVPRRIFKAFLYFNDIDETAGPLEIYVSGASMNPEKHIKVTVPAGTMIFVDTGRFLHRGGYCLEKPRMLSLWYYMNASPMEIPPMETNRRFSAAPGVLKKIGW